jgi:leucyl-tRNA synthetase
MRDCGYLDLPSGEPFASLFTQGMVTHETYQLPSEEVPPELVAERDGHPFHAQTGERLYRTKGVIGWVDRQSGEMVNPQVTHRIVTGPKWLSPEEVRFEGDNVFELSSGKAAKKLGIEKMSKSKKNVVDLDAFVSDYGADVARWFVLSDSPPDRDVEWTDSGVHGSWRFVQRVWALVDEYGQAAPKPGEAAPQTEGEALALRQIAHRTIAGITDDIENFRFNKAVARCYELVNAIAKLKGEGAAETFARGEALALLAQLLSPFMPHLAEEMWEKLGREKFCASAPWPVADPALAAQNTVTLPIQINGKRRGEIQAAKGAPEDEVKALALSNEAVAAFLAGQTVRKVIVVPDRIVNIVAN